MQIKNGCTGASLIFVLLMPNSYQGSALHLEEAKCSAFKTESEKPGRLLFPRRERGTTAKDPFP